MDADGSTTALAVDSTRFRHVVSHLASGVTVLTARDGESVYGMTASSVTSLSVDPPMMLACVNRAVPTAGGISRSGSFGVNVLGEGQGDIAEQFATRSRNKFRGIQVRAGELGMPLILDALAYLECEVVEEIAGGTHVIFIGQVRSASARVGHPLTYYRGDFGRFEFARDDDVYKRAREQVLNRIYGADDVVVLEDIARALDVDKSAAFYALTRLAADGLVRRDPELGYVVNPFDARTSDATFDARLAIQLGVVEQVVDKASEASLRELRRRFEAMVVLLVGDRFVDFGAYLDANYRFHEWIVDLAENPLLTATFGGLSIKTVMTRSFGSTPVTSQAFVDVQRRITEAFEHRDAEAAKAALRDYCALAKERVREILHHTGGRL
ncbi:flavin reductase [Rhizomonospora bruguierae]|uniref:flavin reductase n=1 Tax=Rhizomonospora bruguierae TaxID=1581705 RepID=UPI001BCD90FB|nr:flavin reductase [Micromonospora sp. NBRC 107566]